MTITAIDTLANFAELSVASYALFNRDVLNDTIVQSAALRDKANMTVTQAGNFLDKYSIVDHTPNDSVGFSATVFKDKQSGKYIFAVRGTEIPSDISADLVLADFLQIGPEGYAKSQATSMYRYWRELTTIGGQAVNYSETEILKLFAISQGLTGLVVPAELVPQYATFRLQLLGDKGIEAGQPAGQPLIAPDAVVDVTGHSLGGHLAMLFARLFPSNTGEVVTVNAPGFFPGSVLLTGLGYPPPADGKITRLEADGDGISELGAPGYWPGTKIALAQENQSGPLSALSSNHSSVNSADSLALMRVMAKIDRTWADNAAGLSGILRAATAHSLDTYEIVLDALRKIILGPNITATEGVRIFV